MDDGTRQSGALGTLTGAKGRVGITYVPGDKWPKSISRVKGATCDDDRMTDWILQTIGKDRKWLSEIVSEAKPYAQNLDARTPYNEYHWPGAVCYDYANAALRVHITKPGNP